MYRSMEISPHLFFIPGENRGRFPFANSLFIKGEVNALIDTGAGEGLQEISPKDLDVVLLSHFHPDHVQGNQRFLGSQFFCHPACAPPLLGREDFYQYTGLNQLGEDWESQYPLKVSFLPQIHHYFKDGEVLDFGGVRLLVVHIPGHSPGHTAFFHEESGLLFSGDVDLTSFGPWYGYPSSDIRTFLDSIDRIIHLKPRLLVSGHKGPIGDDLEDKLNTYKKVIFSREEKILQLLSTPRTFKELVKEYLIYGDLSSQLDLLTYFEQVFMEKHLEFLFYRGRIKKEGEYYGQV